VVLVRRVKGDLMARRAARVMIALGPLRETETLDRVPPCKIKLMGHPDHHPRESLDRLVDRVDRKLVGHDPVGQKVADLIPIRCLIGLMPTATIN